MPDPPYNLSRRKLLGAAGTIGGAAAIGGSTTMAFFSDEETFANNQLVAGELDLKVDWTEHYSDWSDDEAQDIGTVSMEPDEGLTGFPSTAPDNQKSVYVSDPDQFMANTAIEAFPDVVDTEEPESITAEDYDGQQVQIDDAICEFPADLDGVLSHPFRTGANVEGGVTIGDEPNPQTTAAGDPLVNISDVKPGDFGEVTFSIHVCGNPAYLWLTGQLVDASENGYTEPEREDPDESLDADGDGEDDRVELLDEMRAAIWYDTGADGSYGADLEDKDSGEGDNVFGTGETLLPVSGSLRSVLTALENQMVALDAEPVSSGGADPPPSDSTTASGTIELDESFVNEVIVTGEDDRFSTQGGNPGRNWQCADYQERIESVENVVGSEVLNPETAPLQVGSTYSGCTNVTIDDLDSNTGTITLSTSGPVLVVSVKGGPNGEQVYVFDEPVVLDEATFTTPGDYGISNIDVCCPADGDGGDGGGGGGGSGDPDGDRECFPGSTTAYIGFEWWLPVDHGNEVQTDSVAFDLGFYAEQCRHNDGSGMNGGNSGS
ncbi:MAG: SipW-dependent-type signal peptide-containing protein [Halolamina sp.]